MPATVKAVVPGSIAQEAGIESGDIIASINGQVLRDIIDYRFLESDEELTLQVEKPNGDAWVVDVEKDVAEPLGIEFESPLFDGVRHCANRCTFCFVDQMPKGLRKTLYMKDDDYRLSFLTGNFVTLTNLSEADWQRIEALRLSPLYVSVHTTDPQLRQRILGNPRAAEIMGQLRRLKAAGIEIHCQIVCVPGVNSGAELDRTLSDLRGLWPAVKSVGIVPVGLTRFRNGLAQLGQWDQTLAEQLIAQVEEKQERYLSQIGTRFVWAADEFYLLADHPIPEPQAYERYSQLENGIGLTARFRQEFFAYMPKLSACCRAGRRLTLVTSPLGEKALSPVVDRIRQIQGLKVAVVVVTNRFFGSSITVAGLLTGEDILAALDGNSPDELGEVLIPGVALNEENRFLDDMPLYRLQAKLGCPVAAVQNGEELAARVCEGWQSQF